MTWDGASADVLLRLGLLFGVGVVGALLPVSGALEELIVRRDATPLDIDARYRKDDRYFATSFEALLTNAVGAAPRPFGVRTGFLRRGEVIETTGGRTVAATPAARSILDVQGSLSVAPGVALAAEALVSQDAHIQGASTLRALKAAGEITLGDAVVVERWVDSGGSLRAGDGCDLGARATSLSEIILGDGVTFRIVSAPRVTVGAAGSAEWRPRRAGRAKHLSDYAPTSARVRADGALVINDDFFVPAGAFASGDLIARGSVRLGEGAILLGSIHSDSEARLDAGAAVVGSVICEKDLLLEERATITEHAVTNGSAIIGRNARIGTSGRTTTLFADQRVQLEDGCVIYGRIVALAGGVSRREAISSLAAIR